MITHAFISHMIKDIIHVCSTNCVGGVIVKCVILVFLSKALEKVISNPLHIRLNKNDVITLPPGRALVVLKINPLKI